MTRARRDARATVLALLLLVAAGVPAASSALTIVPTWDATITNDPRSATVISTINSVLSLYNAKILDNITVNITFQQVTTGLAGSTTQRYSVPYSTYLTQLHAHASSLDDAVALSHLTNPTTDPVIGSTTILVRSALVRALGLVSGVEPNLAVSSAEPDVSILEPAPNARNVRDFDRETFRASLRRAAQAPLAAGQIASDATISLNLNAMNLSPAQNDPTKYSLYSATCHELDEALGNASIMNGLANGAAVVATALEVTDLYRYIGSGARSLTTAPDTVSYFSLDGVNRLARFNQTAPGDYSDFYSPGGQTPQVQDAYGTPGTAPVPNVEFRMLDVYGWKLAPFAYWVDFNYGGGFRDGSWATPFRSLTEAVNAVPAGSSIFIVGGSHSLELATFVKPVTVTAVGATAIVGQ